MTELQKVSNDEKETEDKEEEKAQEKISSLTPEQKLFHYSRAGLLDELRDSKKTNTGLDINTRDQKDGREEGWYGGENTAMHYSCQYGHLNIVKFLLGQQALIDPKNKLGNIPLHVACSNGRTDIVKFLIQNKSPINVKNKIGNTPLHCSVYAGHVEATKCLLDEMENPTQSLQEGNSCGVTPVKYCTHEDMKNFLRQFFRKNTKDTPKLLEEDELDKEMQNNTSSKPEEIDDDDEEEPVVVENPTNTNDNKETNEEPDYQE